MKNIELKLPIKNSIIKNEVIESNVSELTESFIMNENKAYIFNEILKLINNKKEIDLENLKNCLIKIDNITLKIYDEEWMRSIMVLKNNPFGNTTTSHSDNINIENLNIQQLLSSAINEEKNF